MKTSLTDSTFITSLQDLHCKIKSSNLCCWYRIYQIAWTLPMSVVNPENYIVKRFIVDAN